MTLCETSCSIQLLHDLFGLILNDGLGLSLCALKSTVVVLVSCDIKMPQNTPSVCRLNNVSHSSRALIILLTCYL